MKQKWREVQISKCIKRAKTYKWLRVPMLIQIVCIISLDSAVRYLSRNRKRVLGAGLSVLIFLVSNSFSAPVFQRQPGEGQASLEQEGKGAVDLAQSAGTDIGQSGEGLLPEGETDHEHKAINSQYSADEILDNSNSQTLLNQQNRYTGERTEQTGFSKEDWNLILVNKQHPIPEDYTFELGTITANMKCDARIIPELFAMLQAARKEGVNLIVCSPYRDISQQTKLFEQKIKLHMGQGETYLDAYKKASQIVTIPGASEHQIGLAVDFICGEYRILDEGFGMTQAGKWLQEHSKEYGFILRYPKGKEYITGIEYEPWHFRYVGREAAVMIMDQGLTLEEFVESISE